MKKLLIVLLALLCVFALVVVGGGALIDPGIDLSVQKRLPHSAAQLYSHLDSVDGVAKWWSGPPPEGSPPMQVKHKSGPTQGAGTVLTFEADGQTMETWTIKATEPPSKIVYAVDFAGAFVVERTLTLAPDGDGSATNVTWRETGSIESPMMRWFNVLMPAESVTKNFENALDLLARAASTSVSTSPDGGKG